MRLTILKAVRAAAMAGFALSVAVLVGLPVYAALRLGLYWPGAVGFVDPTTRLVLAALTLIPVLFLLARLDWGRPTGWLAARFDRAVAPLDRAVANAEKNGRGESRD